MIGRQTQAYPALPLSHPLLNRRSNGYLSSNSIWRRRRGLTEIYATDSESAVWGPELGEYRDAITGARVRMLTQSKAKDAVIYQTAQSKAH